MKVAVENTLPSSNDSPSKAFLESGLAITWQGVAYSVKSHTDRNEVVTILKDASGFLRPGELTALMGPSGSGKTTLLDLLAGRKTVGVATGELLIAGSKLTHNFLRRYTGYVEQQDTLLDILTVEEMLLYTAELKRPMTETPAERRAVVEELIVRLGLESCRSVRIGSQLARGISGGQAKRVNIGISLVGNPKILFLDEPTSGLDSYTASEVMRALKGLARAGITLAATIHSPTPFCFNLFDRLMMLSQGSVIYFGPQGKAAIDYFHRLFPSCPLQPGQNEAEWLVEVTTKESGRAPELAAAFAGSDLKHLADAERQQLQAHASELSEEDRRVRLVGAATATPFWRGLTTLLKYRTLRHFQTPEFMGPRIGDKLIFSLIIFTLYWKVGEDLSPSNIPNIVSTLFLWTVLAAFGAMVYLPALMLERPLFFRERNDGLYRVITYLAHKMIEELVMALLTSLAFSNLVFWTLGLQGSWLLFWLVYLCSLSIGVVLAYFVASISPNQDIANVLLPTYTTCMLFFTGLLLRWEDIPGYWRWLGYVDFLRYSCGALMVNQFEGDRNVPFIGGVPVLDYYSLGGVSKWAWLGIEAAFFVFFFLGSFLALTYLKHIKR